MTNRGSCLDLYSTNLPIPRGAPVVPRHVRAALFGDRGPGGETLSGIYGARRLNVLRERTRLYPEQVTSENINDHLDKLGDVEVIFSTWGMLRLTPEHLDRMPRLRAVFFAAGSVRPFAAPLMDRGITVVSSWAANAVPVAEFTVGQILLANKGYFRNVREYANGTTYSSAFRGPGNYDVTVSVLGAGQIGRKVIELLRPFRIRVLAYDPFLTEKSAEFLRVEKVGLSEAFERGDIVTNHVAHVPETRGLLTREHFCAMPPGATFINTGRGLTVRQGDLIAVLAARTDLMALLDVTEPEPLPTDSPLRELPNVMISSHIAGSIGREVGRVADYMLDEFEAWSAGKPLRYAVTPEMLNNMA